ncbi:phage tail tube protein [Bacilliculturomica massiliensis]|uniref:phage tail tube protein n=1 Tax=Bacilliculturomica massiliensis TaxID=1917867 RepID=UPI00103244BB|nr:phage tail tube protein [Bacilliculturomica massiliensis]
MNEPLMNATDAVYGALAECYVTLDGNRYKMMQLHEFESKYEVNLIDVPILGRVTAGKKPGGGSGTWSGTAHYNQSVFRKWLLTYKNTGVLTPFDIQVTNEDKGSKSGKQTITHRGCLIDSMILSKFSAGDEILDEELSGTFDDWDMPQEFDLLDGMQ